MCVAVGGIEGRGRRDVRWRGRWQGNHWGKDADGYRVVRCRQAGRRASKRAGRRGGGQRRVCGCGEKEDDGDEEERRGGNASKARMVLCLFEGAEFCRGREKERVKGVEEKSEQRKEKERRSAAGSERERERETRRGEEGSVCLCIVCVQQREGREKSDVVCMDGWMR